MRIQRVLVPIDFSPASTVALNCAITCARRFSATLTLLHVLGSRDGDENKAILKLSAMVAPEDQDDLNVQTVVTHGGAHEKILSTIREQHADLVVMGTHGRSLLDRLFIGSVTLGVLRHIDTPILTVSHATRPLQFEHILFATDLSEGSFSELQSVLDIAQTGKSTVTLLHAVEMGLLQEGALPIGAYITKDYMEHARAKLNELVAKAAQQNVSIEPVLVEGIPAESILKTAEEQSADLIVLSTAHKGLLERALLGSTTERVIRESKIPVLSIPQRVQMNVEQRPGA